MVGVNVFLKLSLRELDDCQTFAKYSGTKSTSVTITQYLPAIWNASEGDCEVFMLMLYATYLFERVCIERAVCNIKIKGGRCNPCCVEDTVLSMVSHITD
jgi:hypothetical protein